MENYTYNSYPDSGNSSPRSREIEFENPSPWEDQPQNYKVKFMCSYAGKIHPRPHDNQLAYIGGETKILAVDRNIKFSSMISKLSALCATGDSDVSFKYQLPGEDLDALISVTNDDDLEHMMHEYDRLYRAPAKPARMRLFIFSAGSANTNFGSEGSRSDRERFVDALNSGPSQGAEKTAAGAPQNKVDFLFGLEKGVSPPLPVKTHDPIPEPVAAPPPPPISEAVGPDHVLNAAEIQRQLQELQRLQIRDQEQQAIYRKKSEDNTSVPFTGEYYTQRLPEKSPSVTLPMAGQPPVPAPTGFWSDKQISGGFPAAVTTTPGPPAEHPVYMIHAPAPTPATVYHAAPPAPAPAPQMVRPVHGQASQGYYTNVQRMPAEMYREQPMYNMMAPPMQHPQAVTAPQVGRPGGGVSVTDAGYAHVGGAFDRQQVYYTTPGGMVVPPQYQGVGVALTSITELSFNMLGFCAALFGCLATSTKTILAESLLHGYKFDSINTVYYMAPFATMILGVPAMLLEGNGIMDWLQSHPYPWSALIIIFSSGVLAFCLNFSIFYVIHSTTAVTFNVAGNLKVAVAVLVSWLIFRNPISALNAVGCGITLIGCTFYGYVRHMLAQQPPGTPRTPRTPRNRMELLPLVNNEKLDDKV